MLANSPLSASYTQFVTYPLTLGSMTESISLWVQDVLMVLFFLVVGMELKRELCEGFLAQRAQVILPLAAAMGGILAPALIFIGLNHGIPETQSGWAIPCATDIAFALCILSMAGKNLPKSARIFLLAIAIFDDLGAILIIAGFYTTHLVWLPLIATVGGGVALWLLNRFRVSHVLAYLLVGLYLWFCLHAAGVHTTVAGVAVGLAIPLRGKREGTRPLEHFLHRLHPWVSFGILPLFALTSAGVSVGEFTLNHLVQPLPLGIALGLFIGKQVGIFGVTWAMVTLRLAPKPEGANWLTIYGIATIAGIGFTMSLFIDQLAFSDQALQSAAKIGILAGSLASGLWGILILRTRAD